MSDLTVLSYLRHGMLPVHTIASGLKSDRGYKKAPVIGEIHTTPVEVIRGTRFGSYSYNVPTFRFTPKRALTGIGLSLLATTALSFGTMRSTPAPAPATTATTAPSTTIVQAPPDTEPQVQITTVSRSLPFTVLYANGQTQFPQEGTAQLETALGGLTDSGATITSLDFTGQASDDIKTDMSSFGREDTLNLDTAKGRGVLAEQAAESNTVVQNLGLSNDQITSDFKEVPFDEIHQQEFARLVEATPDLTQEQALSIYKYGDRASLPTETVSFLDNTLGAARSTVVTINYTEQVRTVTEKPAATVTPEVGVASTTIAQPTSTNSGSKKWNPWALGGLATGVLAFASKKRKETYGTIKDTVLLDGPVSEVQIHLQQTPSLRKKLKHRYTQSRLSVVSNHLLTKVNQWAGREKISSYPSYADTSVYQNLIATNSVGDIQQMRLSQHKSTNVVYDSKISDKLTKTAASIAIKQAMLSNKAASKVIDGIIVLHGDETSATLLPDLKMLVVTINTNSPLRDVFDDIDRNVDYVNEINKTISKAISKIEIDHKRESKVVFAASSNKQALAPVNDIEPLHSYDDESFIMALVEGRPVFEPSVRTLSPANYPGKLSDRTAPVITRTLTLA